MDPSTPDTEHAASDAPAPGTAGPPPGPSAQPGAPPPPPEPPGLREQLGATRDAVIALVRAHIDLARTEAGEILDEIKRVAGLVGAAFGLLVFVALLVPIGGTLWLGEWLFGSMGWGVLHGTELSIGLALALVLIALGRPAGRVFGLLGLSAVVGILVAVILGLNLTNQLWTQIGDASLPGIDPAYRPLLVGTVVGAVALGVVLAVLGAARGGASGVIGGLVGGAIVGALVGAFTAITFAPQAGVALGVAVALAMWPILLGADVARTGIDTEALQARFYPAQTIETTKETIEWVREQTPLGPRS